MFLAVIRIALCGCVWILIFTEPFDFGLQLGGLLFVYGDCVQSHPGDIDHVEGEPMYIHKMTTIQPVASHRPLSHKQTDFAFETHILFR